MILFHSRGSADDYDRFAAVTEDEGWSWDNLQPYIAMVCTISRIRHLTHRVQNEKWEPPADRHNTTGQFNPSVHSLTGINAVSLGGFPQSIDSMVFQAVDELGGIFHFNEDYNSGTPLGFSGYLFQTVLYPRDDLAYLVH